jgi:hypothetical protein
MARMASRNRRRPTASFQPWLEVCNPRRPPHWLLADADFQPALAARLSRVPANGSVVLAGSFWAGSTSFATDPDLIGTRGLVFVLPKYLRRNPFPPKSRDTVEACRVARPKAGQLLNNQIRFAAQGHEQPTAGLPAGFEAWLKTLGS